jgi:hypothetical protein
MKPLTFFMSWTSPRHDEKRDEHGLFLMLEKVRCHRTFLLTKNPDCSGLFIFFILRFFYLDFLGFLDFHFLGFLLALAM